ncbi:MAG TPA: RibD family protein [Anaerolineaceae bacterium]|nr:RibD family protein [Anaerolineaceae bacterium]
MVNIETFLADARRRSVNSDRPEVTLSYAQSLDGCLSIERGWQTRLSGPESMQITHRLRAAHQAILVGIGTVLADDPKLTVRLAVGKNPQPVVIDTRLRIPDSCNLLSRSEGLPWVVFDGKADPARQAELARKGVKLIACETDADGRINLRIAMNKLRQDGIASLMVEGGAGMITSFLADRLADLAAITICPVWIGGLSSVERNLAQRNCWPALENVVTEKAGEDMLVFGQVKERPL